MQMAERGTGKKRGGGGKGTEGGKQNKIPGDNKIKRGINCVEKQTGEGKGGKVMIDEATPKDQVGKKTKRWAKEIAEDKKGMIPDDVAREGKRKVKNGINSGQN